MGSGCCVVTVFNLAQLGDALIPGSAGGCTHPWLSWGMHSSLAQLGDAPSLAQLGDALIPGSAGGCTHPWLSWGMHSSLALWQGPRSEDRWCHTPVMFPSTPHRVLELDQWRAATWVLTSCSLCCWYCTFLVWAVVCQGATTQVRFQPSSGRLLAVAADSVVSILDVQSEACLRTLEVSNSTVLYGAVMYSSVQNLVTFFRIVSL